MARRGENIRKRSDGRWEGRYLIHINGSKKYRSVYATSYNEVKQKLFNSKKESEITLLSQKEQTAPLNASADMSLDEIGQLWLIYMRGRPKRSALSARSRFRNFSFHFFSLVRMMGFMC